jgi:hypothetical protein
LEAAFLKLYSRLLQSVTRLLKLGGKQPFKIIMHIAKQKAPQFSSNRKSVPLSRYER